MNQPIDPKKILIVEDNPISGEDFKRRLINLGYTTMGPLTKGEQVYQTVEADPPDLILMDIRLKGDVNGIEVADDLKRQGKGCPIIYLTAHADPDTIDRAKKTGPYGYIVKPFSDRELQSTIEIALYKYQMERRLQENQQWLETTLRSIGDGVIATDMEGNVSFINPVAESLTGWNTEKALGKPLQKIFKIVNENSGEPCENPADKVIQTGQIIGLANHTLLISRDGRRIPIKDSGAPIQLNGTENIGVVLVFQDDSENRKAEREIRKNNEQLQNEITQRKKIEKALQENESFLTTLIDRIPIPVFYKDDHCRYLGANNAFETFLGKPKEAIIGKTVFDISPPEHASVYHLKDQELLTNGGIQEYETAVQNDKGEIRQVIFNKAIFKNAQGEVGGLIGTILDITERRQSEEEREKIQLQLAQSQKMESIGNLAGGIAHDFNNILSSILGFSDLALRQVETGSPIKDDLKEIQAAGIRAKDLVKQILTFARKSEDIIKPVSVSMIAREALKLIRSSIPTTIEIIDNINSQKQVMGNPTQIHQIFMNLFTNAAHAMDDAGGILNVDVVDITLKSALFRSGVFIRSGNYIKIEIADTGIGISEDAIKFIYEPYFTTKEQGEGTGLGLAVVHGIIDNCGGKIVVESELEKGTRFIAYLPYMEKVDKEKIVPNLTLPTGHEKILFIDDEPQIVKMGYRVLSRLGYTIETCTSSVKALELFQADPGTYDLIISDMTMPKLTGYQLAQQMLETKPDAKIILCTGYSSKLNDQNIKTLGVKALLVKPVTNEKLATIIRKVLDA